MSAAVRCDGPKCKAVHDRPTLKHKLATRVSGGQLKYRDFCSDECLEDWVGTSIDERELAQARMEAAKPSPLAMPPRSTSAPAAHLPAAGADVVAMPLASAGGDQ